MPSKLSSGTQNLQDGEEHAYPLHFPGGDFINYHQTPAQRRWKYNLARSHGFTDRQARQMRDWPRPKLLKHLGIIED